MTYIIEKRTDAVLRLPQVRQITGLGRSSIYAMEASQNFPRRLKLGPRSVGWLESEVLAWVLTRAQGRGTERVVPPVRLENGSIPRAARRPNS
ncbi:MAG: AlpA family phage regulatory protein [Steroidobacteraceae bacterium]